MVCNVARVVHAEIRLMNTSAIAGLAFSKWNSAIQRHARVLMAEFFPPLEMQLSHLTGMMAARLFLRTLLCMSAYSASRPNLSGAMLACVSHMCCHLSLGDAPLSARMF